VQDVSVEDIYKRIKPRKHYVYFIHVYWQDGPITPVYRSYNTLLELQERLLRIKESLQNQKEEETLLKGKKFSDRFTIKKRAKALRRMPAVQEFLKSVVHLPSHISESDPVINFFHPLPADLIEMDHEQKEIYHSLDNVRRVSKSKYIHHISEPILVEQYVVISDYVKREESDISLKAGNVVDVVEKNEHGWWFVDLDGELGWAPASYLEPRDGSMDDQVLEVFEEGQEETYITMAAYEAELEDEISFEMGKIVEVVQKNLDGWWLVKIEEREGWVPSMFLREIATSRHKAREKGKHAVRAMLRDRLNTISAVTGRRQTWDPPKRKKSVKRTIPLQGTKQTQSSSMTTPSYVNLEFHEVAKRQAAGKGRTRQKLDPNAVRAGARLHPITGETQNKENSDGGPVSDRLLKPRPISVVEEEIPETVSRGTSPIPSPLLRQNSNTSSASSSRDSVFHPISLSKCLDEELSTNAPLEGENNESGYGPNAENDVIDSQSDSNGKQDIDDEGEDEGEEYTMYTENMPELVNNKRFYAMGSYEKQDDEEVNLQENAEVEVLKESEGGWWLVRTSSHSIGWAPSNFLEKIQSLRQNMDNANGTELPGDGDFLEVIPIRPPKSPRVLKMAQDMCIERDFWHYIQKGKDSDTCPLDGQEVTPEFPTEADTGTDQTHLEKEATDVVVKSENANEVDTRNCQRSVETKANDVKVMDFAFDDYECDPSSGICLRGSRKTEGIKYVPTYNVPCQDGPKDVLEVNNNVIERSESVPSLAESEDLDDDDDDNDDDDYEQIE